MCQGKKSDLELKEESREVKKSLSQRDYYLYYNNFIPWMRSLKCARFRTYPFPAVSCRNISISSSLMQELFPRGRQTGGRFRSFMLYSELFKTMNSQNNIN